MSTKFALIMFLMLAVSVVVLSQESKSQHPKDETKTARPSRESETFKDQTVTAERKKFLFERLEKVYGEGDFNIETVRMNVEPGDIASGVELTKATEEITIDTTPCGKKKTLVTFHTEYKKEDVSDTTCPDGKKYKRVQVEQK